MIKYLPRIPYQLPITNIHTYYKVTACNRYTNTQYLYVVQLSQYNIFYEIEKKSSIIRTYAILLWYYIILQLLYYYYMGDEPAAAAEIAARAFLYEIIPK